MHINPCGVAPPTGYKRQTAPRAGRGSSYGRGAIAAASRGRGGRAGPGGRTKVNYAAVRSAETVWQEKDNVGVQDAVLLDDYLSEKVASPLHTMLAWGRALAETLLPTVVAQLSCVHSLIHGLPAQVFIENLEKRFKAKLIYTYIGGVCISVNPYKVL